MSEIPNPTSHDQATQLPEGGISTYMDRVLEQAASQGLAKEDYTGVVGDHLTGSILRTQGAEAGFATIKDASHWAGRDIKDPQTGEELPWTRRFTRADGLRKSMLDIAAQPDGKGVFDPMLGRLRVSDSDPGRPVMTTMDQVAAYLGVETEAEAALPQMENASAWKQLIKDEITAFVQISGRKGAWDAAENLGSDLESVRKNQENWQRATATAEKAGLDITLLAKSAEMIREQQQLGAAIGQVATLEVAPDFGNLFD